MKFKGYSLGALTKKWIELHFEEVPQSAVSLLEGVIDSELARIARKSHNDTETNQANKSGVNIPTKIDYFEWNPKWSGDTFIVRFLDDFFVKLNYTRNEEEQNVSIRLFTEGRSRLVRRILNSFDFEMEDNLKADCIGRGFLYSSEEKIPSFGWTEVMLLQPVHYIDIIEEVDKTLKCGCGYDLKKVPLRKAIDVTLKSTTGLVEHKRGFFSGPVPSYILRMPSGERLEGETKEESLERLQTDQFKIRLGLCGVPVRYRGEEKSISAIRTALNSLEIGKEQHRPYKSRPIIGGGPITA